MSAAGIVAPADSRPVLIPARFSAATQAGPPVDGSMQSAGGETMGTTWSLRWVGPADDDVPLSVQALLDRVVAQMSTWREDSDLCRYARAEPGSWQLLPDEFFEVMQQALLVAETSDGAFDPTAAPLVDCWGFGPAPRRRAPPGDAEIEVARMQVGWRRVQLDPTWRRLSQPGGCRLDLSGIAKGYGVDLLARHLCERGIEHFLIEVGGELRGQGCKPDGSPWWVALEQPDAGLADSPLIALDGLAVATSGDYRRYFESGGRRYSHTLDPRSGRPVEQALASVSVIHDSAMLADAWATALTVLGPEAGMARAREQQLAAHFLLRMNDGFFEARCSPAFEALLG